MSESSKGKLNILIVEDDDLHQQLIQKALQSLPIPVNLEMANDVDSALYKLTYQKNFNLVLLDYMLPGKTGLDLIQKIRETFGDKVRIIVITGRGSEEVAANALKLGVDDYIIKSIGYFDEIPEAIAKLYPKMISVVT